MFPPGRFVLEMVLLRVLAVFCTAEIIDVKKLDAELPGVVGMVSGVGVRGALVMVESLLGPMLADRDRPRRCAIIVPFGDALNSGAAGAGAAVAGLSVPCFCRLNPSAKSRSVGVGGVFTMVGVPASPLGGVRGGVEVSIFCPLERRRIRSDAVTFGAAALGSGLSASLLLGVAAGSVALALALAGGRAGSVGSDALPRSELCDFLSGLEFGLALFAEPFLDRNASRRRPMDEGLARVCPGASEEEDEEMVVVVVPVYWDREGAAGARWFGSESRLSRLDSRLLDSAALCVKSDVCRESGG